MATRVSQAQTAVLEFLLHVLADHADRWAANDIKKVRFLHSGQIVLGLGFSPLGITPRCLGVEWRQVCRHDLVIEK